jgi:cytochrome c-type biogenesis protein CcmH
MMGAFLFAAMALVAAAMLLLLRPWQQRGAPPGASTAAVNAGVYADQLAELDRDLAAGTLAGADHATARDELQRRLLDDASAAGPVAGAARRSASTLVALAIALPLGAIGLYALLGSPAAVLGGAAAGAVAHEPDAAAIERMVAGLAARLERDPSDTKGWAMLARSYHAMGRLPEAEQAFARIGPELHRDPTLLATYADVLAARANGTLEGRPLELVTEALKLDPDHPMALSLAATAAYKRHDSREAAKHWRRLLAQLPPDSQEARWVVGTLAEIGAPIDAAAATSADVTNHAGASVGAGSPEAAAAGVPTARADSARRSTSPAPAAAVGAAVSGTVTLAPELLARARPSDTVFVFARATEGGRMPLAVQRARVADLPLRFSLDDSMAMSPQAKLSGAREVRIEARVSRQGTATATPGDLIGASAPIVPGSAGVALTIDRVQP